MKTESLKNVGILLLFGRRRFTSTPKLALNEKEVRELKRVLIRVDSTKLYILKIFVPHTFHTLHYNTLH